MNAPGLGWAVIGTGGIVERFVPDIHTAGERVAAVWGRRSDAARDVAARHAIDVHDVDLDRILARDDVDVVYVATPPATHLEISLRALDSGKHVLVEKPLATAAGDADRILARAAERGLFAMEAMWMKFNPLHREVMRRIGEGLIGDPHYVRGGFGMPFPRSGSRWRAELGGSTVLDQGIYPVTLASWALGAVADVSASGGVSDGVDTRADVTLRHASGGLSHSSCAMTEFVDPSASISGTEGWIEIPAMFWAGDRALVHAGSREAVFHTPDEISRPTDGNGYVPMIGEVARAVADGVREHPWHAHDETIEIHRTLDAIRARIHGNGASV
ncbi:Gfo/Idh/MocA family protein [Microbacterium suaedae]|uniref:Gfo/Idh/MocA family protein n=1 Tax=Microbacterium suaedae TaxID=2067813 RepID=UPI000DA11A6A|nr:Gfo/Idh/MocA family oxidoreductase [Microbacterium suaedae]